LLSLQDTITLANELSIDPSIISSIIRFNIEAIVSDNDKLIQFSRYTKKIDTSLVSILDYEDYLKNIKEQVYTNQQIIISSRTNSNFDKVFDAIVLSINSNTYFKREQDKDLRQLQNRELAIKDALIASDSLQKTYKKILENINELDGKQGSQTSITIEGSEDKSKTKEFDLYKSDIELRNELVTIEREKEDKQFIVELLSNTPSKGFIDTSIEILNKSFSLKIFFACLFSLVMFYILLLLSFIEFLEKYQNKV
jgi:hypothetical protein